ncbi:uncharacterized protein LOC127246864 [Andrographis paniculata]|uniref:uncharacterized protein LOC127246864 n=1 Tax=Andrographis paniculata TaxID=175694 RepID=UPI0021E7C366|nr:uncharacterized protein LOC127246864 [Andrographis paniculata]
MEPKFKARRSWFLRIVLAPVRGLCKVRDLYVRSLSGYADKMSHAGVSGLQVISQDMNPAKSFSVGSARGRGYEDYQELVRAASTRTGGYRGNFDSCVEQQIRAGPGDGPLAMRVRSSSVVMGRIDEDKPCCSFGEDDDGGNGGRGKYGILYPRSKSHGLVR